MTVDAVVRALEKAGIEFTNGGQPGVRIRRTQMMREQFDLPIARFIRGGLPAIQLPHGGLAFPLQLVEIDGVYFLRLKDGDEKVIGSIAFENDGPVYNPPLIGGSHRPDRIPTQQDLGSWAAECWRLHEHGEKAIPICFGYIRK
jgi:hypothetical protein